MHDLKESCCDCFYREVEDLSSVDKLLHISCPLTLNCGQLGFLNRAEYADVCTCMYRVSSESE